MIDDHGMPVRNGQPYRRTDSNLDWTIDPQNLANGPQKTITEIQERAREALATPDVKGIKHDGQKEPLSLLSRVWLLGVASVMGFGAKKYAAHNWRGGIERSRLISAALRHLLAYNEGQDLDPETGLNHLDHASCCLMFARELHVTRPDLDDRYVAPGAKS